MVSRGGSFLTHVAATSSARAPGTVYERSGRARARCARPTCANAARSAQAARAGGGQARAGGARPHARHILHGRRGRARAWAARAGGGRARRRPTARMARRRSSHERLARPPPHSRATSGGTLTLPSWQFSPPLAAAGGRGRAALEAGGGRQVVDATTGNACHRVRCGTLRLRPVTRMLVRSSPTSMYRRLDSVFVQIGRGNMLVWNMLACNTQSA